MWGYMKFWLAVQEMLFEEKFTDDGRTADGRTDNRQRPMTIAYLEPLAQVR